MKLAAHQAHYMPWLGYLDKLRRADVFVVMDDLQFEAQNFQNRNRVKLNQGPGWLTVPLERGAQTDRICDKLIQNVASPKEHWQRRHWKTLEIHYGRTPYFDDFAAELEGVYCRRTWHHLVDLDLHVLDLARTWLGITTPILRSSSLGLRGEKTARLIDLCTRIGADTYLSGRGGSTEYLDVGAMAAAGIRVEWQDFVHPIYPQRYPALGFVSHLAFLDRLFNCGAHEQKEAAA
jgi:hypothetical protein